MSTRETAIINTLLNIVMALGLFLLIQILY